MSRAVSSAAIRAMFAAETDDVFAILLTIDHEELEFPIRATSDLVTTTSRGEDYLAYPFEFVLPSDEEGAPPQAQVSIDNVDREIANTLRSISSPAEFTIEVVRVADPDVVEIQYEQFKMRSITGDASRVSGELSLDDVTSEPYPYLIFSPSRFPGMFS